MNNKLYNNKNDNKKRIHGVIFLLTRPVQNAYKLGMGLELLR